MTAAATPLERLTETRSNLRAITRDGVAFSVMVGTGERYLQAFAVALGHGDLASGLAAPWAVVHLGSQKRWTVLCSAVQTLSWVPLAIGAWVGSFGALPLFAAVTLYWATGFAASPSWTSWVETLVPPRFRERYFARRSAACQAALFVGLVAAGAALHAFDDGSGAHAGSGVRVLSVFAGMFAVAAVARGISTAYLTTQTEPVPLPEDVTHVTVFGVLSRLRGDPAIRALFCIAPLQFAIQSAEPFFAPYVLRHLDAGYGTYLALVAAAFLGRILILPTAGSFARRFGARRILWAGSLGLVPIAALWSVSASPVWLVVVQLLAGMAWGTFELGTFLLLFDAAPYRERTAVATVYYFVMAAAAAGGSLAGGWLLEACGSTRDSYLALFAASTLARIVAFRLVAKGTKPDGPGLITCV